MLGKKAPIVLKKGVSGVICPYCKSNIPDNSEECFVCGEDLKELSGLLWRRQENVVTGYVYAKRYNFDNIVVQSPLFRAKTGVGVGDRFQDI